MPSIRCPSCHRPLAFRDVLRGALVECPACARTFAAPAGAEAEWLACDHPYRMLRALGDRASSRKLLLFCVAWGRRSDRESCDLRRAWEAAERFAEGRASAAEVRSAWPPGDAPPPLGPPPGAVALPSPGSCLEWAFSLTRADLRTPTGVPTLLRCIFGNPFRPATLEPAWLTPNVRTLAQAAYEERALPAGHLDPARLALLADALEEAGCTSPEVLGHLRGPGPHVRGCWAVDSILGEE